MKRLINAPFFGMHRVMDMLCLDLGSTHHTEIITLGNQMISSKVWPTYSLHLQTQWRFIHQGHILLGSRDIYRPFSANADDKWDYIPTDRADEESSVFDVVSREVIAALQGEHIIDCSVSCSGDIHILFSNDYVFETFVPASVQDEEWRLIDFNNDQHLIFYDI